MNRKISRAQPEICGAELSANMMIMSMIVRRSAALLAMRRAIAALPTEADFALVDGNIARDFPIPAQTVIGGDGISPSIAAASILAKVSRDRLCDEMERDYPGYGIGKHKKLHYAHAIFHLFVVLGSILQFICILFYIL